MTFTARVVGFVTRRAGEVRRHLAAALIAATLVIGVTWLVTAPLLGIATSAGALGSSGEDRAA